MYCNICIANLHPSPQGETYVVGGGHIEADIIRRNKISMYEVNCEVYEVFMRAAAASRHRIRIRQIDPQQKSCVIQG